ncbi:MAG: hypothetical protein ABIS91_23610 [Nocardioides sp.]|uniref:hypothetical protein n=1 Tax=Nocardioides sp. TaxID=35761 RepID=UPI00326517C5
MLRRVCSLVVLSLVVTMGQTAVPLAAEANLAGVVSSVDDNQDLVNTAGPLGGLPEPVDPADRIDGLPTNEDLPEGVGTTDVDGSWSEVPGVPVAVREDSDGELPSSVDEVDVTVSAPVSSETVAGETADSLLLSLTPVSPEPAPSSSPTEATATPTPTP